MQKCLRYQKRAARQLGRAAREVQRPNGCGLYLEPAQIKRRCGDEAARKGRAPAWEREPCECIPFPSRFRPGRGVIHPSFPLRGGWDDPSQFGERAPSLSLAIPVTDRRRNARGVGGANGAPNEIKLLEK